MMLLMMVIEGQNRTFVIDQVCSIILKIVVDHQAELVVVIKPQEPLGFTQILFRVEDSACSIAVVVIVVASILAFLGIVHHH